MTRLPLAVLVDDDPQQIMEASSSLSEAGFDILVFESLEDALPFVEATDRLVDLFILDRKLPMRVGEVAADELGDALFNVVAQSHPDARIVVFSGYTDFEHLQKTVAGAGLLLKHDSLNVDRVSVLKKSQYEKFEEIVAELRQVLTALECVEVTSSFDCDVRKRRILQRIAYFYGAIAISADALAGGLTGVPVWRCSLSAPDGPLAGVVAKVGKSIPAPGGLQDLLPLGVIARRVEIIEGLMGGAVVSILQVAGESTISLMSLVGADDSLAARVTEVLRHNLTLAHTPTARWSTLSEIVAQILPWAKFCERLKDFDLQVPPAGMWAKTSLTMSHGDLHASNVLVVDEMPIIIDSDDSSFASALRDPVALLMSSWIHPDSPFVDSGWPSPENLLLDLGADSFATASPSPLWYALVQDWLRSTTCSPRELWATILAFALRQSRFPNVRENPVSRKQVEALIARAHSNLLSA